MGSAFYQKHMRYVRLQKTTEPVELIDARSPDARVRQDWHAGIDLNGGMLFVHQGKVRYGDKAVHTLPLLSSDGRLFGGLSKRVFSSHPVATLLSRC
jgi:hypothetical protein